MIAERSKKVPAPADQKKTETEGALPLTESSDGGKVAGLSPNPVSPAAAPTAVEATPTAVEATPTAVEATPTAVEATPTAGATPPTPTSALPSPQQLLSFITSEELSRIGQAEKTFGALYLEQMFGLLAAILPDSPSVRSNGIRLMHQHGL